MPRSLPCVRASDGASLWTDRFQGEPSSGTPVTAMAVAPESDTVYILASTWRACALRASDGTPRWRTPSNSPSDPLISASSVAADTTGVYMLNQSSNTDTLTRVVALHATDGVLLRQRSLPVFATARAEPKIAPAGRRQDLTARTLSAWSLWAVDLLMTSRTARSPFSHPV